MPVARLRRSAIILTWIFMQRCPRDEHPDLPRTGRRPASSCSSPGRRIRDAAEASCARFANRVRGNVQLLADDAGPSSRAAGSAVRCHGSVPGVPGPAGGPDRMRGPVPRAAGRWSPGDPACGHTPRASAGSRGPSGVAPARSAPGPAALPDAGDHDREHDQDQPHGSGGDDEHGGHQRSAPLLIVRSRNQAAKYAPAANVPVSTAPHWRAEVASRRWPGHPQHRAIGLLAGQLQHPRRIVDPVHSHTPTPASTAVPAQPAAVAAVIKPHPSS